MTLLSPKIANSLWYLSCNPAWRKFQKATEQVELTQGEILKSCLKKNKDTDYGRRYGFDKVDSISSFQKAVPITTYDNYLEEIEEIGNGRLNVLTASPVRLFELSSGSTSASKMIPYCRMYGSKAKSAT